MKPTTENLEKLRAFVKRADEYCEQLDKSPMYVAGDGTDENGAFLDIFTNNYVFRLRNAAVTIEVMMVAQRFHGVCIENPPHLEGKDHPKPYTNLFFANPADLVVYTRQ